jgi:Glycosyl transferase family 2
MKLLVVIPTWNRAEYLNKAIGAISSARAETKRFEVELFISDNCSSDHTAEVLARWQEGNPWIHGHTWEVHTDKGLELLRRVFQGSGLDYDYAWLHGDDDWITESSAFTQLLEAIEANPSNPPAIVHCCATRRAIPGDVRIISGLTEDLCNLYGWHDLLGWFSSLVISRETADLMLTSPQFTLASRSAYCHSEALLDAAYGKPMLVLAAGLIDPQDETQTAECIERWAQAGMGAAYWGIIPGLLNLKERGVLKTPLTLTFFRYLTYSFWDRFAVEVMSLAAREDVSEELIETKLQLLGHLAQLLGYGEDRKLYQNWLDGFVDNVWDTRRAISLIHRRITSSGRPSYSFTLLS